MMKNLSEQTILEIMKRSRLFRTIALEDLEPLLKGSRRVEIAAGEMLFSAGQSSGGLYLVLSGKTRAVRHGADGREQIIHEDGPGSTFPEVAVFDGGPYPSSVFAVEDSQLLFIPKTLVLDFCRRHPEVSLSALRLLSQRLRRATGMVEDFALREVSQRLAEYLLDRQDSESGTLVLTHSNQEIADLIGTVREVVSRSFSKLQKQGWINKEGKRIQVIDRTSLLDYIQS